MFLGPTKFYPNVNPKTFWGARVPYRASSHQNVVEIRHFWPKIGRFAKLRWPKMHSRARHSHFFFGRGKKLAKVFPKNFQIATTKKSRISKFFGVGESPKESKWTFSQHFLGLKRTFLTTFRPIRAYSNLSVFQKMCIRPFWASFDIIGLWNPIFWKSHNASKRVIRQMWQIGWAKLPA